MRVASAELSIPISTVRKVLREMLKMFPYKISFVQHLLREIILGDLINHKGVNAS